MMINIIVDDSGITTWHELEINGYKAMVSEYGDIKKMKDGLFVKFDHRYNNAGYPWISFAGRYRFIHRLVAMAFIPNPNNYKYVLHKNDVKTDNHYSNLYWGTMQMNADDCNKNGLRPRGENAGGSKLTREQAKYIKYNPDGLNYKELAKMHGISIPSVYKIWNEQSWTHI